MDITAKIKGIEYKTLLSEDLKEIDITQFDINDAPSSCLLIDKKIKLAISKWVSPKRTRSYPFERIYNTLQIPKKITVIPIIKDEGVAGDRDFIQWDTISLMSLLDVFVIFAYYTEAERLGEKITNQKFDNRYVVDKIGDIENYHSSALHWNLNELNKNFHSIIDIAKESYLRIEQDIGVKLHNSKGIDNFKKKIGVDVDLFMDFSRGKAAMAQSREVSTIQPKESLSTLSKAKITIMNYLGGQYFLTVDEVKVSGSKINLIESKHSKTAVLPSKGDIKDGLFKMILYSNLQDVKVDHIEKQSEPILVLTSSKLVGNINAFSTENEIEKFCINNKLSNSLIFTIKTIIKEAQSNKFNIEIRYLK